MRYRPEVDGLRAVAVIPVILFHAGFRAFAGGYVGVDVFFVVSGYLITSILLPELEQGRFSLATFYERRARRILPALFLVVCATLPFAYLWLSPRDLENFAQSVTAVATFSSNVLFWRESGYFDTEADLKPLLHTWSLAVEEQYYIFYPLFLALVWRFGKKWIVGLLVLVTVASLGMAQWGAYNEPSAAFFLLPTRGWEILLGAFCAFFLKDRQSAPAAHAPSQILSALGLTGIIASVFLYDGTTPFPSVFTLLPTVGTVLLILFAQPGTLSHRLLSLRPVVWVGLISYSAYLWHQPLLAFAKYRSFGEPPRALIAGLCLLTFPLAYLSWRFVETPFRRKNVIGRRFVAVFSVAALITLGVIGVAGDLTDGAERRFAMPEAVRSSFAWSAREKECFDKKRLHDRPDWLCGLGEDDRSPTFFFFGDSHGFALLDAFDEAARLEGRHGLTTSLGGCIPFLEVYALNEDPGDQNCFALNERVFDYVRANPDIKELFLAGRWSYYTNGGYHGEDLAYIALAKGGERSEAESRKAFEHGLRSTLARYRSIGVDVHIVTQVPQQLVDPMNLFYQVYTSATGPAAVDETLSRVSVREVRHHELQRFPNGLFLRAAKQQPLHLLTLDRHLCAAGVCLVGTSSGSYYYDEHHLSVFGARRTVPSIRSALRAAPKSTGAAAEDRRPGGAGGRGALSP